MVASVITTPPTTSGTFISHSGIFSEQFIALLGQAITDLPALQGGAFATPWEPAMNARELDETIATSFELICEQWDRMRVGFATMTLSEVRERWLRPLMGALDFRWVYLRSDTVVGGDEDLRFNLSHRGWEGGPVIHTVAPAQGLDERSGEQRGVKSRSPHDMTQQYLNVAPSDHWALVTNGRVLRVVRTYHHVFTKGYVEFDLEGICEARDFAGWRALFRMAHSSRFFVAPGATTCPLDQLYDQSIAVGVKVGEDLQKNVRAAIQALGSGFLEGSLLATLRDNEMEAKHFYEEVLRVVYRILFLLYAEQRGMLPGRASLYAQEYSITHLRERVARPFAIDDRRVDLWEGLKVTFRLLEHGAPALGIFAYNGELFSETSTPTLNRYPCRNGSLLNAMSALTFVQRKGGLQRINYADVGVEEIGAVYESLLDYVPRVIGHEEVVEGERVRANTFFLDPRGTSRKTSGSYYTRPELVGELIKSALVPVLAAKLAAAGDDRAARETALLELRVVDPACGSAAFLIAATNYLGRELAQLRAPNGYPDDNQLRRARRDVLMHCIYGVDLNPMAVELAKVSLWITSAVTDLPLNFLDHHIKCGNSLIGATPALLAQGVPDEAFTEVTGDDKRLGRDLRARNKKQRAGQLTLPFAADAPKLGNLAADFAHLAAMPETTPAEVHAKRDAYTALRGERAEFNGRLLADAWCAAFYWPLDADYVDDAPTYGEVMKLEQSPWSVSEDLRERVRDISMQHRFFHWHLEFPDVMAAGGFDCVLGNPPWEQVEIEPVEFFAARVPEIAHAQNMAARNKLIAEGEINKVPAILAYHDQKQQFDRIRKFIRESGRFPLAARGRINLYAIFTENVWNLLNEQGHSGIIVPTGVATDSFTQELFRGIVNSQSLVSLYDFENREGIFPGVHRSYKFALLTVSGRNHKPSQADLVCFVTRVEHLNEKNRHFALSTQDFSLINPNTQNLPIFRSKRDAALTRAIYRSVPIFVREGESEINPWGVRLKLLFMMNTDSRLFRTQRELLARDYTLGVDGVFRKEGRADRVPLYEAKLFHQFDHRFATFEGGAAEDKARDTTSAEHTNPNYFSTPRYWVPYPEVERRTEKRGNSWYLTHRRAARSTDVRTFIAAILPKFGTGDLSPYMSCNPEFSHFIPDLLSNFNSLVFDFCTRQKVGGIHLDFFLVKQLPVLPPETYLQQIGDERLGDWVTRRALELTYTSYDLAPLAHDLGYDGLPFAWDDKRRAHLRGELDGLYAHLYGLTREDFAYILTTFPVLQKNEERAHGEFRTARLALAAYDALAGQIQHA